MVSGGLAGVREPVAVAVGMASMEPTTVDFERARVASAGARIEAFTVGPGFGPDLAYLSSLVAAGQLAQQIGWRGSWEHAGEAAEALLTRTVAGKAVLLV